MGHGAGKGALAPATAAICRAVYDLGEWSQSVISHSPGQSGHPASPNYGDLIDDYLGGRSQQMDFGPGSHQRSYRLLRLLPVA
jgi:acyl-homoserine lactone acylase PvdQ